ncbi:DUF2478 domain-containing protein [Thioclava sp. BHET1]|nr:DUF2478 domain-containing protein [Thioclava sp. BHET1]
MLGYITCDTRGAADLLLADLADRMLSEGRAVIGMVRADVVSRFEGDMHLRLLPGGEVHAISQRLGRGAGACVLDAGALEAVVARVERDLAAAQPGAVALFNKFGKQEAAGRGCRGLIASALGAGMPVVLSVPRETRAAFAQFSGGEAQEIAPNLNALTAFLTSWGD